MADDTPPTPEPGGFLIPSLPSPPHSIASIAATLPHPRSHALKPGSSKETIFANYVEQKLLEISGRYENRGGCSADPQAAGSARAGNGYETFAEVARDLENVFEVIWVSGTPKLQIPFLLNLALATSTYVKSFPFSPRSTFQLLTKLDFAFSGLIHETDVETGKPLPGFERGRRVTMTEKIRIRGLVEQTRINIALVADGERDEKSVTVDRVTDVTEDEDDMILESNDEDKEQDDYDEGSGQWEMEVARVYERSIISLGPYLDGATHIGI